MSFTADEKQKLIDILDINIIQLNVHLAAYVDDIDSAAEDAVREKFDEWDIYNPKSHIKINPNIKNGGAGIAFSAKLDEIRRTVARKLIFDPDDVGGNSSEMRLVRG